MISSLNLKTIHWTECPKKNALRLCLIAIAIFVFIAPNRPAHYSYLLLVGAFWGIELDRLSIPWRRFLGVGIPLVLFPILMWQYFPPIWNDVVYWQLGTRAHLLDLDTLFKSIPGNDGWVFRIIQTPWLTDYFRWIYANGFTLPVLIPIFRSFWAKDSLKMIRYSLSAHVLQFLLIFPFYLTIHVNEVWYVLGQPDGMARNLSAADAAVVVVNCFPSMHTSIAFAMLLLAWREKDKLFRYVWTIFCFSVIYSTLYLEIHWVTDVLAGIVLAVTAVKFGDWLIGIISAKWKTKARNSKTLQDLNCT
ncbi:phosphatase PAP2 family protein [Desulfosporosinus sp. SB140]|uniref:phosphatase PAP2 family protein n=1 Tax=Desulfosporosinus paludis TaxID=3115649 RepID=UPI00388D4609